MHVYDPNHMPTKIKTQIKTFKRTTGKPFTAERVSSIITNPVNKLDSQTYCPTDLMLQIYQTVTKISQNYT